MKLRNPKSVLYVMISYVPYPKKIGEMKTKPTQQAARSLNSAGVQPNIILARSEVQIDEKRKDRSKMAISIKKLASTISQKLESDNPDCLIIEADYVTATSMHIFDNYSTTCSIF